MAVHLSLFWNLLASSFTYAFKLDPSLSNIDPLVLSALFVALLNNIIIMSGFFVGISILLFRWRELYRWLPRPQVNSSGRLENLLLLYTPLQRHGLFYHGIFHVMLIAFYLLLNMEVSLRVLMTIAYDSGFLSDRALWDTFFTVGRSMLIILPIPIILTALAARWQARQVST